MSLWSNSQYEGETKEGWFHGKGRFHYPNGVIYEGSFMKGEFHGDGVLIYPNGGQYRAKWENGKMLSGEYFFKDNLQYDFHDWKHCTGDDRRFHQETQNGIRPAGATQLTKEDVPHNIPQGTYDVGDGYYEPVKSIIYDYKGQMLRTPSQAEVENVLAKCRYNPRLLDISGEDDKMIRKVIEKNNIPEN